MCIRDRARAAQRLAPFAAAEARQLTVPQHWPDGGFDLIVLSEVGYYLAPLELDGLFTRIVGSLAPGGTLLLCHWRHPISGWELDGDGVHARARHRLGWPTAGLYRERDFVIETFLAPEPPSEAGSVE
ncbi:class I SAM-dependent methyltransferase [Arthrobacter sp. KBS0703]|uniref:class I SAM-dependent methyltransferase n=1 Tax=Arthrobacter sp. KBS0703 TaxID=1955698 RepID=UPI0026A568E9|nr:class I SAM-dependent methyltransferase [Arthrobacter sp. KBS0703]